MEKYVRILRDENLMDFVSIDVVDGDRKRKNDIGSRSAMRKYCSHNT